MKNIEYDIPIFESNDLADLDLYSEKMATAIKEQIDKFGNPLAFKGIKQNISELDLISNPQSGDIYGVIETNKNYIWNGKEWIIYSDIMELDNYYNKEEINQKIENIQALPTGGTKGQVLTKQSETNGDANWEDIEANEVFVGNEEEAPETAKIIIEDEDFEESAGLSKAEVYVGAEEPTTGEKVWFRKGNNYLDISRLTTRTTYGITFTPTATGIKITGTAQDTYAYGGSVGIDLKKGKTYTLYGSNAGNTLKLELKKGTTIITSIKTSNNKITFTPNDDINLVTFILEGIVKGTAYNYEISNLQIEQGSSATTYNAYVEPNIYIKNSNELYDNFNIKNEEEYSFTEQVTGKWIDGKPLYSKTLSLTTPSTTSSTKIADFDKTFIIKKYYGNALIAASNQLLPINFYFTNEYNIATYVVNNSGEIYMKIGSEAYKNQQVTLTIEYTKTTD